MIVALVLALAAAELVEWTTPIAILLVRIAAGLLGDPDARTTYRAEWIDSVETAPGVLGKIAVAVSILIRVPFLRWTLNHPQAPVSVSSPSATTMVLATPGLAVALSATASLTVTAVVETPEDDPRRIDIRLDCPGQEP